MREADGGLPQEYFRLIHNGFLNDETSESEKKVEGVYIQPKVSAGEKKVAYKGNNEY